VERAAVGALAEVREAVQEDSMGRAAQTVALSNIARYHHLPLASIDAA